MLEPESLIKLQLPTETAKQLADLHAEKLGPRDSVAFFRKLRSYLVFAWSGHIWIYAPSVQDLDQGTLHCWTMTGECLSSQEFQRPRQPPEYWQPGKLVINDQVFFWLGPGTGLEAEPSEQPAAGEQLRPLVAASTTKEALDAEASDKFEVIKMGFSRNCLWALYDQLDPAPGQVGRNPRFFTTCYDGRLQLVTESHSSIVRDAFGHRITEHQTVQYFQCNAPKVTFRERFFELEPSSGEPKLIRESESPNHDFPIYEPICDYETERRKVVLYPSYEGYAWWTIERNSKTLFRDNFLGTPPARPAMDWDIDPNIIPEPLVGQCVVDTWEFPLAAYDSRLVTIRLFTVWKSSGFVIFGDFCLDHNPLEVNGCSAPVNLTRVAHGLLWQRRTDFQPKWTRGVEIYFANRFSNSHCNSSDKCELSINTEKHTASWQVEYDWST